MLTQRIRRRKKGFTLIEVVVASTISLVFLALASNWLLGLVLVAAESRQTNDSSQIVYALDKLEKDFTSQVSCQDPFNAKIPEVRVSPSSLAVVTLSSEGNEQVVKWRLQGNQLQRGITEGCSFGAEPQWDTIVNNVKANFGPDNAPYLFEGVEDGLIVEASGEVDILRIGIASSETNAYTVRTLK